VTDPNMTRFMMSLEDSVDLVVHAYRHGKQGDLFIQKAPAATIGDLAQALKELFDKPKVEIRVMGTRHGEKLFEALVSREEMARADDSERYFRVPADGRDLNYNKYFTSGEIEVSQREDYTSHNTKRLSVTELKELLMSLDYIQKSLKGREVELL